MEHTAVTTPKKGGLWAAMIQRQTAPSPEDVNIETISPHLVRSPAQSGALHHVASPAHVTRASPVSKQPSMAANVVIDQVSYEDKDKTKAKPKAKPKGKGKTKKVKSVDESAMGPPTTIAKASRGRKRVNEPATSAPPSGKKRPPLPVKREEDNYEISDREEETGDTVDDLDRKHKTIPKWCTDVETLVQSQGDVDPDSVFGTSVPKCDLDEIFTDDLYKKLKLAKHTRTRGSSRIWTKDRLRRSEVTLYNHKMGHKRRLSVLARKLSLAQQRR